MEFPLGLFQSELEIVLNTIPSDHTVSKAEILALSPELIRKIQVISHYIFGNHINHPFDANHYACMQETAITCAGKIIHSLENGTVVLTPGDSPTKIVKLLEFLYYNAEIERWEYELEGQIIRKELQFISFPLSGISAWPVEELDAYVNSILDPVLDPQITNISYFDNIDTGSTLEALNGVLQRRLGNPGFEMKVMNLELTCFDIAEGGCPDENLFLVNFFVDAEGEECRCTPPYSYLDNQKMILPPINFQRCNLFLIVLYLRAIGGLEPLPNLPPFNPKVLELGLEPGDYRATYYDVETGSIESDIVRYELFYGSTYGFRRIRPGATEFPRMNPKYFLTLAPSDIDYPVSEWAPNPEDIGKLGVATLINGQKVILMAAQHSMESAPRNWINWTGFPLGTWTRFSYVLNFVPLSE